MIIYKFTDSLMHTYYHKCHWILNEEQRVAGQGALCTSGWLHCYDSKEQAALFSPRHLHRTDSVKFFVGEGSGECRTDGTKWGFERITLQREIASRPTISRVNARLLVLELVEHIAIYQMRNNSSFTQDTISEVQEYMRLVRDGEKANLAQKEYFASVARMAVKSVERYEFLSMLSEEYNTPQITQRVASIISRTYEEEMWKYEENRDVRCIPSVLPFYELINRASKHKAWEA